MKPLYARLFETSKSVILFNEISRESMYMQFVHFVVMVSVVKMISASSYIHTYFARVVDSDFH